MELNQIRCFLEVARSQHVTKSAEKLHIAQPALTQTIHRLEAELGLPLFLAKGRGIVLTEYGRYLQERLEPILRELDGVPEAMRKMAKLERKTIRLSVRAASTLTTEAIIEYKKAHAELNFQVMQSGDEGLHDIDITTKLFYREARGEDAYVCSEKIFLALPRGHELASRGYISLAEVAGEDFISLMGSRPLRSICDGFCAQAGFTPRIVFESDSPAAVINMIAANMGIGFWPEFTWGRPNSDGVVLLGIEKSACSRDIIITRRHNKADNGAVDDFYDFLCSRFERAKGGC